MDRTHLASLKRWFDQYSASFAMRSPEDQRNITVKRDHTHEVCLNAETIARGLGLGDADALVAEAVALFHDVGRFSQYREYRTFDDDISINHAVQGAAILRKQDVLRELPKPEQDLIVRAVALHNVFTIPPSLEPKTLLFVKLVRDADKLDIMRVIIGHFEQDAGERADAVALGLPDAPDYSPKMLICVHRGDRAQKADLTTQNDFKLLQLAWLYDLNFAVSLRMVEERDYIRKIENLLPRTGEIREAVEQVRGHVKRKARSGSGPRERAASA